MTVPAVFQAMNPGGSPTTDVICRHNGCGLAYSTHTGMVCTICNGSVEHHQPGDFDGCFAGRLRMATARQRVGLPLNVVDRSVLDAAQDVVA